MNKVPMWYALYTKPRWEKKVADLLARKGVEQYCPLNKVTRQWSDRRKTVLEPLFTSYVFVRIREEELLTVRQTTGVLNLVHWLGKPAVIKADEINAIKLFLQKYQDVQLERTAVNVNDTVSIIGGPFVQQQGRVLEVNHKLLKVQLPSLGFALVAQIARDNVKIVSIKQAVYQEKMVANS